VVAIMAEGKEHALAIGLLKMSTEEMWVKRKGTTFIGDGTNHILLSIAVRSTRASVATIFIIWTTPCGKSYLRQLERWFTNR
jgi:hypothetical protein